MAQQAGNQAFVLGIERDDAQLAKAASPLNNMPHLNNSGERKQIEFRAGDAYALPLSEAEWGSFDLVFSRFLLEHLAHPEVAVQQMVKAVRPGGRVVLVDDDHAVYRPWPEPPEFVPLWDAYVGLFLATGSDPFVGRRLVSLLHDAGVEKLANAGLFFGGAAGTDDFFLVSENLIEAFSGAKAQLISKSSLTSQSSLTEASFAEGIAALRQWQSDPSAALWYNLCWAEGTK